MKKILLLCVFVYSVFANAQTPNEKYKRSSLTMILLKGSSLVTSSQQSSEQDIRVDNSPEAIQFLWNSYPFPEQYDKHNIQTQNFNVSSPLSAKDIIEARKDKNQQKDAEAIKERVDEELRKNKVAHQIVRRWFSSPDGKMWDVSTIKERGAYNASLIDIKEAELTSQGAERTIQNIGDELIENSFVTVTDLLIYENKPVADMYRALADALTKSAQETVNKAQGKSESEVMAANISALIMNSTSVGFLVAAEAIKDGYTILSKTFLYKLKWDKVTEDQFNKIWGNDYAFNQMDFELEYIGYQINETVLNRGVFNKSSKRNPEVVIIEAFVRNVDEVFALLQKKNDVFKPMMPITGIDPIQVPIGLKEGITRNSRFVVLEKRIDEKNGKVYWKKVGKLRAYQIWDNRYSILDDEPKNDGSTPPDENALKATLFKGRGEIAPGMVIKLIK